MEQYSSNPRNIQRTKRIRTPPVQTALSTTVTSLTVGSKQSTVRIVQADLIYYELHSEFLTAQNASNTVDASSSNLTSTNSVSLPKPDKNISSQPNPSSLSPKQKRTQTVQGQAFEEKKKLKHSKINVREKKQSIK